LRAFGGIQRESEDRYEPTALIDLIDQRRVGKWIVTDGAFAPASELGKGDGRGRCGRYEALER
jgi:hypothetical protein